MGGTAVEKEEQGSRFARMSDWELVSVYVNRGYGDDLTLMRALVAELEARRLPIPEQMPERRQATPTPPAMSRGTFLEYVLLVYSVTGILYSWLYLPMRLVKKDFGVDRKHKLIQAGIALAYQAAEVAAGIALAGEFQG